MNVAVPVWNGRLSPVFDTCHRVRVVKSEAGRVLEDVELSLPEQPASKVICLAQYGVETLICGAITRPAEALAAAYGMTVIGFMAGNVDEVLNAWLRGSPHLVRFAMPGCRRRCCHAWRRGHSGLRHQRNEPET